MGIAIWRFGAQKGPPGDRFWCPVGCFWALGRRKNVKKVKMCFLPKAGRSKTRVKGAQKRPKGTQRATIWGQKCDPKTDQKTKREKTGKREPQGSLPDIGPCALGPQGSLGRG